MNFGNFLNPSNNLVVQDGSNIISVSSTGVTFSNTTHSIQTASPSMSFQQRFSNQDMVSTAMHNVTRPSAFDAFESIFMMPRNFFDFNVPSQPNSISVLTSMSQRPSLSSLLPTPSFFSHQTITTRPSQIFSTNIDATLDIFDFLFNDVSLEESKQDTGLSREQIAGLKTSLFKDKDKKDCGGIEVETSRMKTRNGISKKPKEPTNTISSSKDKESTKKSEPTSNGTCAICIGDYKNGEKVTDLPCSHKFHKGCIDEWLVVKNSCPVCKAKVVETGQASQQPELNQEPSITTILPGFAHQIIGLTNNLANVQRSNHGSLSRPLQNRPTTAVNFSFNSSDLWNDLFSQNNTTRAQPNTDREENLSVVDPSTHQGQSIQPKPKSAPSRKREARATNKRRKN